MEALLATIVVVVSCPEKGSKNPDGSAPYDQEVMTMLIEVQKQGRIKIAFDRAGTSTAVAEDERKFQAAKAIRKDDPHNREWKEMIMQTHWWKQYTSGVKSFLLSQAQDHQGTLKVICINVRHRF